MNRSGAASLKTSPLERLMRLHRSAGNQAVQRIFKAGNISAKLAVGAPNDIYEQEADRVAGQVMRMSAPRIRLKPT
jgi:hypothetical protein